MPCQDGGLHSHLLTRVLSDFHQRAMLAEGAGPKPSSGPQAPSARGTAEAADRGAAARGTLWATGSQVVSGAEGEEDWDSGAGTQRRSVTQVQLADRSRAGTQGLAGSPIGAGERDAVDGALFAVHRMQIRPYLSSAHVMEWDDRIRFHLRS